MNSQHATLEDFGGVRGAVGNKVAKVGSSQFLAIPESQARGLDCTEREP